MSVLIKLTNAGRDNEVINIPGDKQLLAFCATPRRVHRLVCTEIVSLLIIVYILYMDGMKLGVVCLKEIHYDFSSNQ